MESNKQDSNNIQDAQLEENLNEWVLKAREIFKAYTNNGENKMSYREFDSFIETFLSDQTEKIKKSFPREQLFKDYSNDKSYLDSKEFEKAYEDINLYRAETKDSI